MNKNQIAAVIVTYQPDLPRLTDLLNVLRDQAQWLIVVDNGSNVDVSSLMTDDDILLSLPENLGLAAAQNAGIERALALGAEFVYLSDQDSLPTPGMIARLEKAYHQAAANNEAVAAVAAATVDARTGAQSFFMVERNGWPRQFLPKKDNHAAVETCFLIASGTLISTAVIRAVGGMRSSYFIDHVDTEWCYRVRAVGYRLLGVPAALLQHRLGDSVKRIWFLRWRQVMSHSPLRDYYMFRNTLLMLRDTPMKWRERIFFLWRLLQFATYFLAFGEKRMQRASLMSRGLWHGMKGKSGRLDLASGRLSPIPPTKLDPH